jgi:hypothetical protein
VLRVIVSPFTTLREVVTAAEPRKFPEVLASQKDT